MSIMQRDKTAGGEYRVGLVETLQEMMKEDERIVALDADLGGASFFINFKESNPDRFIDVGICEANMFGVAAGLSLRGYIPFVHTMAAFVTRRALDQLYISCAYNKLPVNIYASDPGFCVGFDGGTHTTFEDIGIMRSIPGVTIFEPADQTQMRWAAKTAAGLKGVQYIRAFRKTASQIYAPGTQFTVGKAEVLREGSDVLLVSSGYLLNDALDAAEMLAERGVSVEVVDMVTLKPFDAERIKNDAKGKKLVVTYENHGVINGVGSAVADVLAENAIGVPLHKIGAHDVFGQVGTVDELKKVFKLTAADAVAEIEAALK